MILEQSVSSHISAKFLLLVIVNRYWMVRKSWRTIYCRTTDDISIPISVLIAT